MTRTLKTMLIGNSHKMFAFGQIMGVDTCSIWAKSGFIVTKWRHDVPWSWRCFSAYEKRPFPRACHSSAASVHGSLLSTHMVPLALDKHRLYQIEKPHCKSAACNISAKREPPKRPMQSSEGSIAKLLKLRIRRGYLPSPVSSLLGTRDL